MGPNDSGCTERHTIPDSESPVTFDWRGREKLAQAAISHPNRRVMERSMPTD